MEAELTALVTSGATTVVTLMASDAWNAMRSPIVELLRRDSATQQDPGGVDPVKAGARVPRAGPCRFSVASVPP
jgi:hypothetical protein